ncbi:MAG: hypothetical protein IIY49_06525 [Eubacterium sp.]|nr:hypothetical protein [Eubacterium sp.]
MKIISRKDSNRSFRFISIILVIVLCASFLLTGCGSEGLLNDSDSVLTFNKKSIPIGEVYVYSKAVIEEYEKTYGSDIWSMKINSDTDAMDMEELTRRDIIDNIVKVKVLCIQSKNLGVSLTPEEEMKADNEATEFWKNLTDDQKESMSLTKDIVSTVIQENALAKKTYDKVVEDASIEISDEEARETVIYDMFFDCYSLDSNGDVVPLNDENKEIMRKKAVQAYDTLISPVDSSGEKNIEALSNYYGLKYSRYYTLTPQEMDEKYGEKISAMIYSLDDDTYSLVTESEYGYHIFYVKALTDRKATDERKIELKEKKQKEYFDALYKNWLRSIDDGYDYDVSVNKKLFDDIKF